MDYAVCDSQYTYCTVMSVIYLLSTELKKTWSCTNHGCGPALTSVSYIVHTHVYTAHRNRYGLAAQSQLVDVDCSHPDPTYSDPLSSFWDISFRCASNAQLFIGCASNALIASDCFGLVLLLTFRV
jgi:hypothetical protein